MKPGLPWSVKGIEPDARKAAKLAAQRSGMSLGEWLNSTIRAEADGKPAPRPRAAPSRDKPTLALERTASRLEDIATHLARLSSVEHSTAARIGIQSMDERDHVPSEDFQKIVGRIESNERQTVEAFTAVNERLTILGRQMTSAIKSTAQPRPEDSPGYQALEKAVRSIVEHMESSEKRNRDQMKSLQDRMSSMSVKAQSASSGDVLKQAPAFLQLENRLGELARRIEHNESQRPAGLPDLLKNELTGLAERIEGVRETAEVLASKAQTQAVQASQQELRAIEARILGLLKEAQNSLSNNGAGPAEMQRLRGEIERLNRRIDEAQTRQNDNGDVKALRSQLEQLSTRVAQGPDMRPLADMDRRILDITQRLEQTQAATRTLPHFNELENRIAELDHRFSEVVAGRGSAHSQDLEARLTDVTERVARTEQHLSSLETIERAVNQLFDSFEQQRKWTEEVAETAATRMGDRMMAHMSSLAPQPVALAGSPEIRALEDGLAAVKSAAQNSDVRNQETLEAVHETLEQIVSKLAELETAAIGQRVAAAVAPAAMAAPVAHFAEAEAQDELPQSNAFELSLGPVPRFEDQAQQPNNPLEAAPVIASTNPFEANSGTPTANIAPGDDFIAAARRAAQASQQQKSLLASIAPGAARLSEENSKRLLSLDIFKRKKVEKAPAGMGLAGEIKPPPGFKAANSNESAGKRRKLLLMGLVLLAAVSAFTFNIMGKSSKAKVNTPTAIEKTMEKKAKKVPAEAKPAAPKPAPVVEEGNLLDGEADPIQTAALPNIDKDIDLGELVEQASSPDNMPPAEVGNASLREAAAIGNVNAQFMIASRYMSGEQVKQDYAKAAYWFGKAAAQGSAPAQYRVATMYEKGKGVARDLKAALGWYERAAALGNVKAMHNAAVLSAGNDIGAPDYPRAFKWFSLGAAHGLKDSQYNLAVLLERGLGTDANPKDAMFWYSMAAQQDDGDALKRANALSKVLSPAERMEVQSKLAAWKPESPPDVANVVAVSNREWAVETPQG